MDVEVRRWPGERLAVEDLRAREIPRLLLIEGDERSLKTEPRQHEKGHDNDDGEDRLTDQVWSHVRLT